MSRLAGATLVLAALCLPASVSPGAASGQTITGMVFERRSGSPIQRASVNVLGPHLEDLAPGLLTDAFGRFRVVMSDPGTFLLVARHMDYLTSAPEMVALEPGDSATVLLALDPLRPDTMAVETGVLKDGSHGADVYGIVVDNQSGQPIRAAEVRMIGLEGAVTGSNGRFFIRDLPPGPARVYVQHLSYQPWETHIDLEDGVAYEVEFRLDPDPLELPGVEVKAMSRRIARRLEPVYDRMDRSTTAYFRTEKDFTARGYPPVGAMIRGLPGVRVAQRGGLKWSVEMGGSVLLTGGRCVPAIYLDGIRVSTPQTDTTGLSALSEFMAMSTMDVAVIEIYPGAASLPPEFNDPGSMCAIGIWTKRGGG